MVRIAGMEGCWFFECEAEGRGDLGSWETQGGRVAGWLGS